MGRRHPHYVSNGGQPRQLEPADFEGLIAGTLVQTMQKGYAVSGTVRDPEGRPITDANVTIYTNTDYLVSYNMEITKTDREGQYRITNCGFGKNVIVVAAPEPRLDHEGDEY